MGGARTSAAPPVSHNRPPLPPADLSDDGERVGAPLVFQKPANIDPFASMFGMVRLSQKDQVWPAFGDVPLTPLLQINLTQAPFVPAAIHDLSLITLFVSEGHSDVPTQVIDTLNPDANANWALCSYATLEGLTIPRAPHNDSRLIPLLGEWTAACSEPRPDYESNNPAELITTVIDGVQHHQLPVKRRPQTKLGGWPETLHVIPWWADPALKDIWDFVMQIENEPRAGWHGWGNGAAYIARSRERPHLWAIDVQFN